MQKAGSALHHKGCICDGTSQCDLSLGIHTCEANQAEVHVLPYLAIQVSKIDLIAINIFCFQLMKVVVRALDVVRTKEASNRHLTCNMLC